MLMQLYIIIEIIVFIVCSIIAIIYFIVKKLNDDSNESSNNNIIVNPSPVTEQPITYEQIEKEKQKVLTVKIDTIIRTDYPDIIEWHVHDHEKISLYGNAIYLIILSFTSNQKKYRILEANIKENKFRLHTDINAISGYNTKRILNTLFYYVKDDLYDLYEKASETNIYDAYFTIPYSKNEYLRYYIKEMIEYHNTTVEKQIFGNRRMLQWWQLPIYGESYTDKEGVYFARVSKCDLYQCNHSKWLNPYTENMTPTECGRYAELYIPRYIFRNYKGQNFWNRKIWNAYIPSAEGIDPEIDCIIICTIGIVCMECKHRTLPVSFTKIDDRYWYDSVGNSFESPLKQNEYHVKALQRYLNENDYENIPIYNLIAFYHKNCETFLPENRLMVEEYENNNAYTLIGNEMEVEKKFSELLFYAYNREKLLSVEEINGIYDFLFRNTQRTEEEKTQILENKINRKE